MEEKLKQLEAVSRRLVPSAEERALLQKKIIEYSEKYLSSVPNLPAFLATTDQGAGLLDSPISDDPIDIDRVLRTLKEHVDRPGVNLASQGYLAFIPATGLYVSALADYLAAVTNRYSGVFFASPGAVRMESMLVRWMADFLGYPDTAGGDLTSGGSVANLVAVVSARDAHELRARDYPKSVVYVTSQTHHSVEKALRIAGLGECVKRYVSLDGRYRMRADELEAAVRSDRRSGLKPWLLAAAAGSTDTGTVDPLDDLAGVARAHDLWYHVDGAYGATFALCEPGRRALAGIEKSDSLILDPHKSLYVPLGLGAVLVRDVGAMRRAFRYHADYMQDQDVLASPAELSPADTSPELTRPFRGLRLWLALKLAGVAPFRAALEEKLILARYFYDKIKNVEGFEVGHEPDLSIVPFRYVPRRGDADEFNRRLINAIQTDGRVFMSSTKLNGRFYLRAAVLALRTHKDTVDLALEIIREKVKTLEQ